jgi:hypothetical protein
VVQPSSGGPHKKGSREDLCASVCCPIRQAQSSATNLYGVGGEVQRAKHRIARDGAGDSACAGRADGVAGCVEALEAARRPRRQHFRQPRRSFIPKLPRHTNQNTQTEQKCMNFDDNGAGHRTNLQRSTGSPLKLYLGIETETAFGGWTSGDSASCKLSHNQMHKQDMKLMPHLQHLMGSN